MLGETEKNYDLKDLETEYKSVKNSNTVQKDRYI